MYFRSHVHHQMKKQSVDLKLTQISKIASEMWNKADEETKKSFLEKSATDKSRYHQQMDEFKEKGYFITEQGIKSTDSAAKDQTSKVSHRTKPKQKVQAPTKKFNRE